MLTRGRKKSIRAPIGNRVGGDGMGHRPEPPPELSRDEAMIWERIVSRMPANWFGDDNRHLVHSLVCCIWTARRIEAELREMQLSPSSHYTSLLSAYQKQLGQMTSLSTRLRLTPQSRHTPITAAAAHRDVPTATPWEH
jgi:hypothetical protein